MHSWELFARRVGEESNVACLPACLNASLPASQLSGLCLGWRFASSISGCVPPSSSSRNVSNERRPRRRQQQNRVLDRLVARCLIVPFSTRKCSFRFLFFFSCLIDWWLLSKTLSVSECKRARISHRRTRLLFGGRFGDRAGECNATNKKEQFRVNRPIAISTVLASFHRVRRAFLMIRFPKCFWYESIHEKGSARSSSDKGIRLRDGQRFCEGAFHWAFFFFFFFTSSVVQCINNDRLCRYRRSRGPG